MYQVLSITYVVLSYRVFLALAKIYRGIGKTLVISRYIRLQRTLEMTSVTFLS